MASVSHTCIDNSGETSVVTINLPDVTAANYDDITGNSIGQNVGNLRLAIAAITLCNFVRHTVNTATYADSGELPANAYAQRELKLLVRYIDTVTSKKHSITIPGPNLSILAQQGTDVVDHVSNVEAAAFVAAFEANARSPEGNPVSVQGMRIIGLNS